MEPFLLAALSFLGALSLAGIGHLVRSNSRQSEKLEAVATTLAAISATLSQVVLRVDALDRWKDAMQQRETDELRAENAELRQNHGRRSSDAL